MKSYEIPDPEQYDPLFSPGLIGPDHFIQYTKLFEGAFRARTGRELSQIDSSNGRSKKYLQAYRDALLERFRTREDEPPFGKEFFERIDAILDPDPSSDERKRIRAKIIKMYDQANKLSAQDSCPDSFRKILVEFLDDKSHRLEEPMRQLTIPQLKAKVLHWHVADSFNQLQELASQGESTALHAILSLTLPAVDTLNKTVSKKPDAVKPTSQNLSVWPTLRSNYSPIDNRGIDLLKKLKVGAQIPLPLYRSAKWQHKSIATRWALYLIKKIESVRGESEDRDFQFPWMAGAAKLDQFDSDSWEEWSKTARKILDEEFVDVVQIKELNESVKAKKDRKKGESTIRTRIHSKIKERFKSLSGATAHKG